MATAKSYTEEEMKLFARATSEIKLDTTNTLWSDLTGVLRNLKKKIENNTLPCSRGSVGK
jgi:hypothetical protein